MRKCTFFAAVCGMLLLATSVFASGPCPDATGPFVSSAYTSGGAGCNVVITFNANGSITTTIPNSFPYDGTEDTLVGVVNNTASAIASFNLTGGGGSQLFGFDGDGACDGFGDYETTANCAGATDPSGYGGPGVTFSNINGSFTSGTVNFAGGITANGGTAWFSLEEPPSLNIIVNNTPEPASLLLLGTGLLGLGVTRLRRRK